MPPGRTSATQSDATGPNAGRPNPSSPDTGRSN
jgi:hypothetical protein